MRDVKKNIEKGNNLVSNTRYDMVYGEIQELYKMANNGKDIFNLISNAFCFGVSIGYNKGKAKK